MNLLLLIFFGYVATVCAVYKIPEYDACTLAVLLCDDFTKPLTPIDNSTLEMFETIEQLNAVCEELSTFRDCLKTAETFCHETSELNVGFELLDNRRLAFAFCDPSSIHQLFYMEIKGCVNKYSRSAIEFCTDKAVEKVGLNFDLRDFESECRFLGTMQHCHIAIITDKCGSFSGAMLEKLVVFRGKRDFMCIGYETEHLQSLEAFYATRTYVQQYRNSEYQAETERKVEKNDAMKNLKMQQSIIQNRTSNSFQSRISPMLVEYSASDNDIQYWYSRHHVGNLYKESNRVQSTNRIGAMPSYVHKHGINNGQSKPFDEKYNFYMPETLDDYPVDTVIHYISSGEENLENQFEVRDSKKSQDFGENWNTFLVDESLLEKNSDVSSTPPPPTLSKSPSHLYRPYELYRPRMGENFAADERDKSSKDLEITVVSKSSSNPNEIPFEVIAENDCPRHLHEEDMCPILPENISKLVKKPRQYSKISYLDMANPLDTFEPKSYEKFSIPETLDDKALNMIRVAEEIENIYTDNRQDCHELYVVTPSTEIEMSSVAHQTVNKDADIQNLEENDCASHLYGEGICPILPENISKLVKKPGQYSRISYLNMVDPLGTFEPKSYKKFSIPETLDDKALNMISKAEEIENIYTDNKQDCYEELYIVTPSTEIEMSSAAHQTVNKDTDTVNLEENTQVLTAKGKNQDFAEVLEDSDSKGLTRENDSITKVKSTRSKFLELISIDKRPLSYKFDSSVNLKVASKEKFSPETKIFSRKLGQKYEIEKEENLLNAFEILANIKLNISRIRKALREKKIGITATDLKKIEL